MNSQTHIFTSITSNYIPKARVLANSLKKFHGDFTFHLVLCDKVPEGFDIDSEPFDNILLVEELPISEVKSWIFRHTIVELCTGVKGLVFEELFQTYKAEKVFFFDPDILVLSDLNYLLNALDTSSILLTPHQISPDKTPEAIVDNEICSLKHGVYNLGFLGVRNTETGLAFVKWWAERLYLFCYDNKPLGLFTDQRWVDLAPAFFDDIHIIREPHFNVATWNLSHRTATGSLENGIFVNGKPLCFYHFSGFDSGDQEIMLKKYGNHSPVLFQLRKDYIRQCKELGQEAFGKLKCVYSYFDDGTPISYRQRMLYRSREDLQEAYPDPYSVADADNSYKRWCELTGETLAPGIDTQVETVEALKNHLMQTYGELAYIKNSKTWRWMQAIRRLLGKEPMRYSG